MKIELTRGTVIAGLAMNAGDVVDVNENLASMLIGAGKGIPFAEKEKTVDRSVGLETSSAPKTKSRKAEK